MTHSHRLFIYAPVALLALAAAGYSLFWYVAAGALSRDLDAANGREVMPGVVLAFADKAVGGFPFRIDVVLTGVTVSNQAERGERAWRSERVAIHRLSYRADRYVFEADGLQSLSWPGEDDRLRILHLRPAVARASAILRNGRLARADLDLWGVQGRDMTQGADGSREFVAQRAQAHMLLREGGEYDLALRMDQAQVGEVYRFPLGDRFGAVMRGSTVRGEALSALLTGRQGFSAAFDAWEMAGGAIAVTALTVESDVFRGVTFAGTLALNGQHRLEGVLRSVRPVEGAVPVLVVRDGRLGG